MTLETLPDLMGMLGLAAAIPLAILGLLVLGLRERRTVNLAFAAFTITWALQIATTNLGRLATDADTQASLFRGSILLLLATSLFLAWFASLHPRRNRIGSGPRGMLLVALVPLAGFLMMLLHPEALVRITVDPTTGDGSVVLGPLVPYVSVPIFMAALAYAILSQLVAVRTGPTPTLRARARFVYLALTLFFSYYTTRNFLFYWIPWTNDPSNLEIAIRVLFYSIGLLFVIALAIYLRLRSVRQQADLGMVLALVVPLWVAMLEFALVPAGVTLETGWFWRLVAVALLAYAIARYQMFDLDLRYRRAALYAIPVGVSAFTVAIIVAILGAPVHPMATAGGFSFTVAANVAAWSYRDRLANRFLLVGGDGAAYVDHRRLEVYRAALEDRYDPDRDDWRDPEGLRRLREKLGIDEKAHRILAYAVSRTTPRRNTPERDVAAVVLGRYRLHRLLGEGGQGRTLLAVDTQTGEEVAVKKVGLAPLGGRAAELLMREARILSHLDHPNIVHIMDAQQNDEEAVLVMEYVDGGNLAGLMTRRGFLNPHEAIPLVDQILAGLETAHEQGIIHRDLKGENILLHRDGTAKLADFGIAREARTDATAASGLAAAGTLPWMSPEQVRGVDADRRSDLYTVGALLYRLLTGKHYVDLAGRDDFQVRQAILTTPPRRHDKVPYPLWAILERALAKEPADRFADSAAMRAALKAAHEATRSTLSTEATATTTA